jgi:hypothetical protein
MQQQHRCTCADSFHQRLAGSEESLRSRLNQTMLQISDMIHVNKYPGKEVPTDERRGLTGPTVLIGASHGHRLELAKQLTADRTPRSSAQPPPGDLNRFVRSGRPCF